MVRNITFLFFTFISLFTSAQDITVVDYDTNDPVSNCTIYGEDNISFVITDREGKANLAIFGQKDRKSVV